MKFAHLKEIIREKQTPQEIRDLLNKCLLKYLRKIGKTSFDDLDSIEIEYLPFDDFRSLVDQEGKSMFSEKSYRLLQFAIDTGNADLVGLVLDNPECKYDASGVFQGVSYRGFFSGNIFDYIMSKLPESNDRDFEKFSRPYKVLNALMERLEFCSVRNKDFRACLLTHAITSGNLTVAKMAIESSEPDFFNFQTYQTNKGSVRFDNQASVMEYLLVFLSQISRDYKTFHDYKSYSIDTQLELLSAGFCITDMIFAKDPSLRETGRGQELNELFTSCVRDELVRGKTKDLVERFGGHQVFSADFLGKIGLSVDDLERAQHGGGGDAAAQDPRERQGHTADFRSGGGAASATTDPDEASLSSQPGTSNQDTLNEILLRMYPGEPLRTGDRRRTLDDILLRMSTDLKPKTPATGGVAQSDGGDAASATTDPDEASLSSQSQTSNQDTLNEILTKMYDTGYAEHAPATGGAAPRVDPRNPSASNRGSDKSRSGGGSPTL